MIAELINLSKCVPIYKTEAANYNPVWGLRVFKCSITWTLCKQATIKDDGTPATIRTCSDTEHHA